MHFMVVKKLRIRSAFVIYSYFKDSTCTAVKVHLSPSTYSVKNGIQSLRAIEGLDW